MECYTHGTDFRNFYWEGNQGWKILSSFSYVTCCLPMINNLWSDVDDISSPGQGQVDQALIQFLSFFVLITDPVFYFTEMHQLSHSPRGWRLKLVVWAQRLLYRALNDQKTQRRTWGWSQPRYTNSIKILERPKSTSYLSLCMLQHNFVLKITLCRG